MGHRYRQHDILTATPEMLVQRLFEGAIRHARRALELEEPRALAERCRALDRARAIVCELRGALDLEGGGELAANLDRLYGFALERLVEAGLANQREPVAEAIRVLEPLLDAFRELARGTAPESDAPEPAARRSA